MIKSFFIVLLFFITNYSFGQNLVPNPDFEDTIGCPKTDGTIQVYKCKGWNCYGGSPEYYNACAAKNGLGVPYNGWGYQKALSGKAYCAFVGFSPGIPDFREMVGAKLLAPLIKGGKYYASFHVSLADKVDGACNNLGITFSSVERVTDNANLNFVINNRPFVYTNAIIRDSMNWVNISGSFIADSNYKYIVIGNFLKDGLTNYETTNSQGMFNGAYYYLDDICVSSDSLTCVNKTGFKTLSKVKNVLVYPNPFLDNVTFKVNGIEQGEVVIFDLLSKEIEKHAFSDTITLDLEYLTKGIYYYEISNQIGVIDRGKLVKG